MHHDELHFPRSQMQGQYFLSLELQFLFLNKVMVILGEFYVFLIIVV